VSSRANRRAQRSSARGAGGRGRRTPVRAKTGGRGVPWVPIGVVASVGLVIAVVVYLVIQSGQSASNDLAKWANAEKETGTAPAGELPGEGVDLQTIYDGVYGGGEGLANTGPHVTRSVDYETDQGLPPTGGPHWGSSACGEDPASAPPFCGPVDWGIYREPWEAASLVHSMEHGGVVVWYSTTNQEIIDELEALVQGHLEDDELLVLAPYPDMGEETIAVTAWARRDKFPVSEYTPERVETFIDTMKCRFNPETMSGAGC